MPTSGRNPHRPLIFFGSPSLRRNRKAHQLRQDERGLGSSPKDKAKSLSIAEGYEALAPGAGTIHCHGARARAEPGHQGRRDAVQRGPALIAALLRGIAKAEPLAAGRAVGIQALNCSACQRVHRSLRRAAATREKYRVNERNSAPAALVSQEKYPLLVGVYIREAREGDRSSRIGRTFDLKKAQSRLTAGVFCGEAFSSVCNSASFFSASSMACCLSAILACSSVSFRAPPRSLE